MREIGLARGFAAIGIVTAAGCYSGLDTTRASAGSADDGIGADTEGGNETEGDSADDGDAVPEDYEPGPVALRLLLPHQYTETIRGLLGDAAADAADPPSVGALNGFASIGAAQLALGDVEIDRFETSARDVAAVAMEDSALISSLQGCTPTGTLDADCHGQFVDTFGRLAFRRPLEQIESDQYTAVAQTAAEELGAFEAGIEAVIAAMLQSPHFVYQVEVGEPDPDDDARRRLTGYEMATRMAFFLTGRGPDSDLLDLAEAGDLDTSAGVRDVARELVETVEARVALDNFAGELLRLEELDVVAKDPAIFPTYDAELAAAMRDETLQLIEHIAWEEDGDFRAVFDADYTFVNDRLAAHYGIPGTFGPEFVRVELPPEQKRGGILGHAGILSVLAHVGSTSPTLRGKFVRETLLCTTIPAPPPDVATDLPTGDTTTLRERLEQHMEEPSCRGCHLLMDGIGFGLESYDGVGAFRTLENGVPVDDASELDGVAFAGARELGTILRDKTESTECLILNLYRHATGHLETQSETEQLVGVSEAFADGGYRLRDALVEIVSSPTFRVVGEPL
jgi:hypothetical protein